MVVPKSVETVSFWIAVVTPVLYFPLVVDGIAGDDGVVLLALLCLNVLAIVLGRGYRRD